ncbi:hypothetical protein OZX62_03215 [Bifidobacterium sp. ESL0690]|uniref:hypothetical protein n=1 Tax=Bifidobacterium sp. ESL0690 TaxID=2983214 RepID=UPI0023F88D4A|nr:hypothetical protein [Bifidobacterium sp. ESL0690]WEV47302.1 hypothetical protein OZX62_03215 [Bifidobacterium sp. ESL0690]
MKRKKLERRLWEIARLHNLDITFREGGNHTIVVIGSTQSTIPRHREINEITANSIIRYFERNLDGKQ